MTKKLFGLNAIILLFFILDRILKTIALKGAVGKFSFFKFSLFFNQNIALGIPVSGFLLYFLLILAVLLVVLMLVEAYRKKKTVDVFLWTMILAGAFSNLFDRLKYGSVIDYLDLSFFTVFNLADAMISIGVVVLACRVVFPDHRFFPSTADKKS